MGGREEECGEASEDEGGLYLVVDQDDSNLILGNIENYAENIALEEENETPQIK